MRIIVSLLNKNLKHKLQAAKNEHIHIRNCLDLSPHFHIVRLMLEKYRLPVHERVESWITTTSWKLNCILIDGEINKYIHTKGGQLFRRADFGC